MTHHLRIVLFAAAVFVVAACGSQSKVEEKTQPKEVTEAPVKPEAEESAVPSQIQQMLSRFAPVDIGVDVSKIKDEHRPVIKRLIEAGRYIDTLFKLQVTNQQAVWREQIAGNEKDREILPYYDQMCGPWDRLDHDKPFWGEKNKPEGVTFYPEDMTKEEFNAWLEAHPNDKEAFTGYFSVIRRAKDDPKKLIAVPYSVEYKNYLAPAARSLKAASELATDARLKKYLVGRSEAFFSDNYRPSDMDWMDLGDGDLEVVIGPYEVYEDRLFGYKTAFEAIVTLRDPEESAKLDALKALLPEMEAYLPIDDQYKNNQRGTESPLAVVDVLWTGGDISAGVHTLAFNLPNDEVVREQKGSKKVMFKNVAEAKYAKILLPIAKRLMTPEQLKNVSFDAFFNHTLVHETAHGLGPGKITVERDGKQIKTSVNAELKELYSIIEEAKADVLGSYLNYMLIEKGLRSAEFEEQSYASLLGGFFRSMRFGASEAHGMANVIQLNYMVEKGAVVFQDGKWVYVSAKMKDTLRSLAHDILMIEAHGDYDGAKAMIAKYGKLPAQLQEQLTALNDIPTDIAANYTIEQHLDGWK